MNSQPQTRSPVSKQKLVVESNSPPKFVLAIAWVPLANIFTLGNLSQREFIIVVVVIFIILVSINFSDSLLCE